MEKKFTIFVKTISER